MSKGLGCVERMILAFCKRQIIAMRNDFSGYSEQSLSRALRSLKRKGLLGNDYEYHLSEKGFLSVNKTANVADLLTFTEYQKQVWEKITANKVFLESISFKKPV